MIKQNAGEIICGILALVAIVFFVVAIVFFVGAFAGKRLALQEACGEACYPRAVTEASANACTCVDKTVIWQTRVEKQ